MMSRSMLTCVVVAVLAAGLVVTQFVRGEGGNAAEPTGKLTAMEKKVADLERRVARLERHAGLTTSRPQSREAVRTGLPDEFHFYCLKCLKESVVKRKDMPKLAPSDLGGPGEMVLFPKFTCVQCGSKTAILERQCPWCQAYYVTQSMKSSTLDPNDAKSDAICPKCGRNAIDFYTRKR